MVVQVRSRICYSSKSMEGNQQKVEANILVLGAENAGKSALTVGFLTRRFIGENGDIGTWITNHHSLDFLVAVASNGEESGHISDRQLQWADGYILAYSICDRASFIVVQQQVQCIRQAKQKLASIAPIIIVGNKRDLQHLRAVSSEEDQYEKFEKHHQRTMGF